MTKDLTFLSLNVFLILIACICGNISVRVRQILILILNCFVFYWLNGIFLLIILGQAFAIQKICILTKAEGRGYVFLGVMVSLGPLLFARVPGTLQIVGISFYSLQLFGYLMDVRWKRTEPEESLMKFLAYVFFFGNLISGPIERSKSFLAQSQKKFRLSAEVFTKGSTYIYLGLFKKFVLAENLAVYILPVFGRPNHYSGLPVIFAILMSKFYLYYDLSGYSDIVVGVSKMFGIELTRNFNRPIFANNITEFWKRWHISVSTWIRDYIFFPLLTTRLSVIGLSGILTISFVIFGLWHGIKMTFVIYGVLQALFLITSPRIEKIFSRIPSKILRWLCFYTLFLSIPSALFFSKSLMRFFKILKATCLAQKVSFWTYANWGRVALPILLIVIVLFEFATYRFFSFDWTTWLMKRSFITQYLIILSAMILLAALAKIDTNVDFVYWKF